MYILNYKNSSSNVHIKLYTHEIKGCGSAEGTTSSLVRGLDF